MFGLGGDREEADREEERGHCVSNDVPECEAQKLVH